MVKSLGLDQIAMADVSNESDVSVLRLLSFVAKSWLFHDLKSDGVSFWSKIWPPFEAGL